MKKYFVVETEEMCELGDVLVINLVKKTRNSTVEVEKEVCLDEDSVDLLLEMGVIEEREVEEEEDSLLDFEEPCEELNSLIEDFEKMDSRMDRLESRIRALETLVTNSKETASPKKKQ